MAEANFPENVRQFIIECIDSIEQLEILLLLKSTPDKRWNFKMISDELRSSPDSIKGRLAALEKSRVVQKVDGMYHYSPATIELKKAVDDLNEVYRYKKQKIFELIFSPMKKIQHFADAFIVHQPKPKKGDSNE